MIKKVVAMCFFLLPLNFPVQSGEFVPDVRKSNHINIGNSTILDNGLFKFAPAAFHPEKMDCSIENGNSIMCKSEFSNGETRYIKLFKKKRTVNDTPEFHCNWASNNVSTELDKHCSPLNKNSEVKKSWWRGCRDSSAIGMHPIMGVVLINFVEEHFYVTRNKKKKLSYENQRLGNSRVFSLVLTDDFVYYIFGSDNIGNTWTVYNEKEVWPIVDELPFHYFVRLYDVESSSAPTFPWDAEDSRKIIQEYLKKERALRGIESDGSLELAPLHEVERNH